MVIPLVNNKCLITALVGQIGINSRRHIQRLCWQHFHIMSIIWKCYSPIFIFTFPLTKNLFLCTIYYDKQNSSYGSGKMNNKQILLSILLCLHVPSFLYGQWIDTTVSVGSFPIALAYNPANNKVYCANWGSNGITIIDGETNAIIGGAGAGARPHKLFYNQLHNKVYCVNSESDDISVIDGETNANVATITVGDLPGPLAYNNLNDALYCACKNSDSVFVIDCSADTIIAAIKVGDKPSALVYNQVNNKIYCSNLYDHNISVIDGATNTIITSIESAFPNTLIYNPTNNKFYCSVDGGVDVIDGSADTIITTLSVGNQTFAFAYNPTNNSIYSTNIWNDTVYVIDGALDTILTYIPVIGGRPLIYNIASNKVFCAHGGNSVSVIDCTADTVIITLPVENEPRDFTWNSAQNRIYVANYGSASVTIIQDEAGIEEQDVSKDIMPFLEVLPNPFSRSMAINYRIPDHCNAKLEVWDMAGRLIKGLSLSADQARGQIIWHGCDNNGNQQSSGIYFLKFTSGQHIEIKKIIKIK